MLSDSHNNKMLSHPIELHFGFEFPEGNNSWRIPHLIQFVNWDNKLSQDSCKIRMHANLLFVILVPTQISIIKKDKMCLLQ